jgi:tetratricopeptide (TPR) repeat protein
MAALFVLERVCGGIAGLDLGDKMKAVMARVALARVLLGLSLALTVSAQNQKPSSSPNGQDPDDILNAPMTPPRSGKPEPQPEADPDAPGTYSSSKDNKDLTPPPAGDNHDGGDVTIAPSNGVMEMKPWDPHEADKDVEVGMFYFKRNNYRAAEARYRDALKWQDNHGEARYRLGQVLEKEGKKAEARQNYEAYLKILPQGEFAADSRKALERLGSATEGQKKTDKKKATSPPS